MTAEKNTLHPGQWWRPLEDGRFECFLCPRNCRVHPGQRAFCYVRVGTEEGISLSTYGRSSGFCIDPIEKKPLNHFYPGSSVLSFGTAGCNLGCKFCQNWDVSKASNDDRLMRDASPGAIIQAALKHDCRSVAFTYNDPVIFAEYAIDTAREAQSAGIKSVAVTAGYISPEARPDFFGVMDAVNIDLKAFTEEFYRFQASGHLEPVKESIKFAVLESEAWVELTVLLIPGLNDSDEEVKRLSNWVLQEIGPDVPIHFTAFHPDYKMLDRERTPLKTLLSARTLAREAGIHHVYTGNATSPTTSSTYCKACNEVLVERDRYLLGDYAVVDGACENCGEEVPGCFDNIPGTWGPRRLPISID